LLFKLVVLASGSSSWVVAVAATATATTRLVSEQTLCAQIGQSGRFGDELRLDLGTVLWHVHVPARGSERELAMRAKPCFEFAVTNALLGFAQQIPNIHRMGDATAEAGKHHWDSVSDAFGQLLFGHFGDWLRHSRSNRGGGCHRTALPSLVDRTTRPLIQSSR